MSKKSKQRKLLKRQRDFEHKMGIERQKTVDFIRLHHGIIESKSLMFPYAWTFQTPTAVNLDSGKVATAIRDLNDIVKSANILRQFFREELRKEDKKS